MTSTRQLAETLRQIENTAERAAVYAEMINRFDLTADQVEVLQVLAGMIPADEATAPAKRVNPRAATRAKLAAAGYNMQARLAGQI